MAQIRVLGYVLPNKPDLTTKAFFANSNRAEQYAQLLLDSGDYSAVSITDQLNQQHWLPREQD